MHDPHTPAPQWLTTAEANPAHLTPVMRQVIDAKRQHPDALVLFRLGDFYELFFEDALAAATLLELTLTSRNKQDPRPIPMCGFPYHALSGHVQRALEAGRRCAIVEQLEDPAQAKGIVQRGVTHVITPGVVLETEALDTRRAHHLVALAAARRGGLGLAVADASTGETGAAAIQHPAALAVMLARLEPREVVLTDEAAAWLDGVGGTHGLPQARRQLPQDPKPGAEVDAALQLLGAYLSEVRPQSTRWLAQPQRLDLQPHLQLPREAVLHLELLATARLGRRQGALLTAVDRTLTAGGARLLRALIVAPLADRRAIELRHSAVQALVLDRPARHGVREQLRLLCDVPRVATRAAAGMATPREIAALRQTLQILPTLQAILAPVVAHSVALLQASADLGGGGGLLASLEAALAELPRATLDEGGVIRSGFDSQLDELVQLTEHGQQWLDSYEASQRSATGIANLKVTYNRVSGYGIEISRSRAEQVPPGYHRRQTLKNVERYMTDELAAFERKVQTAEQGRLQRETQLYRQLLAEVSAEGAALRTIGRALAELDVHAAFAELAVEQRYVRPQLVDEPVLWLQRCRHPVIEQLLPGGSFVPNDLLLAGDGAGSVLPSERTAEAAQLLLITGPNMAGKSTLMRQAALAVLLAQAGSFVPAEEAVMGVFDGVLTRIGAGDDIAEGASTFLVEMREVAAILARATPRTLVVLDEIGRGTSTYDGLAIAWAVVEQLHDKARALCLCATHYHELTHLAQKLTRLRNVHVAVHEWQQEVVFVHQLQPGPTSKSHGVAVARLAGLPPAVIERARKLVEQFERSHKKTSADVLQAAASRQLDLFDGASPPPAAAPADPQTAALMQQLRGLDMDALTPRQAWELLDRLVASARGDADEAVDTSL